MKRKLWRRAEALFRAALERPPEAARHSSMKPAVKPLSCADGAL
jgi:hypothetical protein